MAEQGTGLTRREIQILEFVARGFSAKETALEIGIAPRTVEGHIDTIKLKLRARNRAHMVTNAIAARILTVAEGPDGMSGAQEMRWPAPPYLATYG
ncbi:MAG TPA: helix-turn-helix transcriptional regulator [Croceibacterium sp.]|jgi:DNA-binding CsgD family transcriptional regulator|nr:helix-turn-helix transcriptional regulator [Croceibacterium sp.]